MSWGIHAQGQPKAVAASIEKQLAGAGRAPMPEAAIRCELSTAIALALAAYPADTLVRVSGCGSQYDPNYHDPNRRGQQVVNTFELKVESLGPYLVDLPQ